MGFGDAGLNILGSLRYCGSSGGSELMCRHGLRRRACIWGMGVWCDVEVAKSLARSWVSWPRGVYSRK